MDFVIKGFNVIEKLGESMHASVFMACIDEDPEHILVLKKIKSNFCNDGLISELSGQIEQLSSLALFQGLVPVIHHNRDGDIVLIRDYIEGQILTDWLSSHTTNFLDEFFAISVSLSKVLDNIHRCGFSHRGIKPSNILVNPDTLTALLIDYERIIDINVTSHYIYNNNFCRNTLPYVSPEQTGRIGIQVDSLTDFYSLGIVLYEILKGAPPFLSSNPQEVIYSHLAEIPAPLCKHDPDIPEMIDNIIARLMLKEPEKRYRTGSGLIHDLDRCMEEYLKKGSISSFQLGLRDHSNRIRLPSIMVGRDKDKKLLLSEHRLSCSGNFRSVMISGLPGIGKTRLIQELEKPVVSEKGYFITGKFDQFQENVPYSTLIQALSHLIRMFLTEEPDRVEGWKYIIGSALGQNGRLITDSIPVLESLIGVQPEVVSLPPAEAKIRFSDTVERFISSLAGPEHPLTIFIDDLQWCDNATFDVIENIYVNSKDHQYLFLLGAYRHNEVKQGHPFYNLLERVREMIVPLTEIRLNELELAHTKEMVAHILSTSTEKTDTLSEIVNETSEGNPLIVNELLSWLHENNLISQCEDGIWQWDSKKISGLPIPENVEELFRSKILRMPENILRLLQIAACLGGSFKIEDLSMLTGMSKANIYREFAIVFRQGILVRKKDYLSFFHDRVQEAIDYTLDDKSRRSIHAQIAKAYIKAIPEGCNLESIDNLFLIVEHLNKGRYLEVDQQIRHRDAWFNYHAGIKALSALAWDSAYFFFRQSRELLPEDCWDSDYEFTFSLYKSLGSIELTQGHIAESEEIINILLEKSKTDLDRTECLAEQSTIFLSMGQYERSINVANEGLDYFDKSIPDNDDEVLSRLKEKLAEIENMNISPFDILKMGPVTNRKDIDELALFNLLIPAYYATGQVQKLFLAGIEASYLSFHVGINERSIYPIGIYISVLLVQGHYETAFAYEDITIKLCNRYPDTPGQIRGMDVIIWLTYHWRHHPFEVFQYSRKVIESGKRTGDVFHSGLAYCAAFWSAALQCRDLDNVEDCVVECMAFSTKYKLNLQLELTKGMKSGWIDPMKGSVQAIDIEKDISIWLKSKQYTLLGNYYIHSGIAQYYLGDFKKADLHLKLAEDFLVGHTINIPNRQWHIFYVLNIFRLSQTNPAEYNSESILEKIYPLLEKIELWVSFGPALKPYLAFIHAEQKKIEGEYRDTRNFYLDAIDIAHEQEYTLLEGHIHETLGEFFLEYGIIQADYHIEKAAKSYKKCHAETKLRLVQEKHVCILSRADEYSQNQIFSEQMFDSDLIMKATRAIYQELDIIELLKIFIKSLMEGVGAQECYMITIKGNDLVLSIKGKKEKEINLIHIDEPLSETKAISPAMVYYVQRTRKTLILRDALKEGDFTGNKETQELGLSSVLIHPVMREQRLAGIVCLQNSLINSVFTEEQVEIVRKLSMHASIAMENAKLVEDMKETQRIIMDRDMFFRQSQEMSKMVAWNWHLADDLIKWYGDMTSLFGLSDEDIAHSRDFFNFICPDDHEEIMQGIKISMDTSADFRVEFRLTGKDDVMRWIMAQGGILSGNENRPTIFGGMIMDITEQKRNEKDLAKYSDHLEDLVRDRTAQLEAANKELKSFAYSVSHDLRAPLRAVDGFSLALLEDYEEKLDDKGKHYLNRIRYGAKSMGQLIDDLLSFSRITLSVMRYEDVCLSRLVGVIAEEIRKEAPERHLEFNIAPDLTVNCDRHLFIIVIRNLLENAWKFTGRCEHARVDFGCTESKGKKVYFVRDNGVGFDMAYADNMFAAFRRLHSEKEFSGTGIGLATVQRILHRHGGSIWAEGVVDEGATFYFSL